MKVFILSVLTFIYTLAYADFDWAIGNTSVSLSSSAYCETNVYLNRTYSGYATGFKPYFVIDEPKYDTQVKFFLLFFLLFNLSHFL